MSSYDNDDWQVDAWGRIIPVPDTSGMFEPVRCTRCGGIYDLDKVTVTARYHDCSMWKAPCCGALVDDRPSGGGIIVKVSDIERLRR